MPCNFCHGNDMMTLFEVEERITGRNTEFAVLKCKNCGLACTSPQPVKSELAVYYPEESYYSFQTTDSSALKERLKDICLEEIGGYPQPAKRNILLRFARKLITQMMAKNISVIIPYIENGRILDVGCGSGRFLKWLKEHGWDVYGVELSEKAAQNAAKSGLNVFCGELQDAGYSSGSFDAILINQVLEHVHDPMAILREANRLLKNGGRLIVGVPNIESYESRIFGEYWSPLDIPRHLYHFSFPVLAAMLDMTGFYVSKSVGKMFFIPHSNRQSLRYLAEKESKLKFLHALASIYLLKIPYYLMHRSRNTLGEFITIYADKKPEQNPDNENTNN